MTIKRKSYSGKRTCFIAALLIAQAPNSPHKPRARATSAAPWYFKPFTIERNDERGYVDGALYHNNPSRVADIERRLIWPASEVLQPDILLSIGTGCNSEILAKVQHGKGFERPEVGQISAQYSLEAKTRRRKWFSKGESKPKRRDLLVGLKNFIESNLDTEIMWRDFISNMPQGADDDSRYLRINPDLGKEIPRLDQATKVDDLQRQVRAVFNEDEEIRQKLDTASRRLIASCFYAKLAATPIDSQKSITVSGMSSAYYLSNLKLTLAACLYCRFASNPAEIRSLGRYFRKLTTQHFRPHFTIREKDSPAKMQRVFIGVSVVDDMLSQGNLQLESFQVPVLHDSATINITLSLVSGEELPISGFPRCLTVAKVEQRMLCWYQPGSQRIRLIFFSS